VSIPFPLDEHLSVPYFGLEGRDLVPSVTLRYRGGKPMTTFGKRIQELRKQRGWSQPELAKKIGTSGAIIGRYERGQMTPSIEVARKLADAFGVTVDYLVGADSLPSALRDRTMLERWQALEGLSADDRERILFVIDGLIRDAKARKAYTAVG
jgi:transcriptional regulator with XRE-family HTH domain